MRSPVTPPEFRRWRMSDGYELQGRVWYPHSGNPTQAILYLHGIQSHGGWFEWSASILAAGGSAVILPDRRGSGMNEAGRGDVPSSKRWLEDLDELAAWAEREVGVSRVGMVGVSWGGKLALAWAFRQCDRVSRLLLIAPGLFPAVDVGIRERFRIGRSLLTGGTRLLGIPLDDPALFTDNPAGRDFIARDPLKLTRATARFFWHSRRLDLQLLRAPVRALQADTLMILAGGDRIIRNPPTESFLLRAGAARTRVVIVPHEAHTLEFSRDVTQYRSLLKNWRDDDK